MGLWQWLHFPLDFNALENDHSLPPHVQRLTEPDGKAPSMQRLITQVGYDWSDLAILNASIITLHVKNGWLYISTIKQSALKYITWLNTVYRKLISNRQVKVKVWKNWLPCKHLSRKPNYCFYLDTKYVEPIRQGGGILYWQQSQPTKKTYPNCACTRQQSCKTYTRETETDRRLKGETHKSTSPSTAGAKLKNKQQKDYRKISKCLEIK